MREAGRHNDNSATGWSRLKPVTVDYLESIGLVSKGDGRLLDPKTQERYFDKIKDRCEQPGIENVRGSTLDQALTSLSLNDGGQKPLEASKQAPQEPAMADNASQNVARESRDMTIIVQAMRKLREAIVATGRTDGFALQVYVFVIRITILAKHMESYHPALLHLLGKIHPVTPLSESGLCELVGYYILDLACRQSDLGAAYHVRYKFGYRDAKVEAVLKAIVHGNWWAYWKTEEMMDLHQQQLMAYGKDRMSSHALKCLGQSYLNLGKNGVEQSAQQTWEDIKRNDNRNWQLEGDVVVFRRIKRR